MSNKIFKIQAYTCNSSIGEAEAQGSSVQGKPGPQKTLSQDRKTKQKNSNEIYSELLFFFLPNWKVVKI